MQSSAMGKPVSAAINKRPGKLKAAPSHRRRSSTQAPVKSRSGRTTQTAEQTAEQTGGKTDGSATVSSDSRSSDDTQHRATAIEQCVQNELRRYFEMLDGEEPANLYRMVIRQAENAVIGMVMEECRGNQTRASEWLGISRGNLRTKLAGMDK